MASIYVDSFYSWVDGPTWLEARVNAQALKGDLVSINNSEENDFLYINFAADKVKSNNNHVWIGASDQASEGQWSWANGDPWTYTNWESGRPDNAGSGEDYGMISLNRDGQWDDVRNNYYQEQAPGSHIRGIAEIPLSYFSIEDASFREGKGGDVTITRTGGTTTSQTLRVRSSDGSASIADDDYVAVNTTISFAAGETSKTINVSTTADLEVENDETFALIISAEGSDDVPPQISDGSANITIKADDFKRGDSLYTIVNGPSWTEAEREAKRIGGNLTAITSTDENDWIWNTFNILGMHDDNTKKNNYSAIAYWIGFTDSEQENEWKWTNGEKSSFSIWHDDRALGGQLSPNGGRSENYAYLGGYVDKTWDDQPNTWNYKDFTINGIAEIPLNIIPTYSISHSKAAIKENKGDGHHGESTMTTVNTTNVSPGTQLYFSIVGSGANQAGINQADFSTPLQANIMINSHGKGSHLNTVIRDELTEGDESFILKLYTDLDRTNLVAISEPVRISDTSTTPVPTYSIVSSPAPINEGGTLKTTVSTTNVAPGTLLYWNISGSKVNKEDFSSGSLSGSCTIDSSGNCYISHSFAEDKLTEGDESFALNFFSDPKGNTPLASSSSITIRDTSISPKPPTYSLSLTPRTIDEGEAFRASITTEYLDPGTRLYYTIKGDVDSSDLSGDLTGSIAIDNSGSASFTRRTIKDLFTEGTESADVVLYTDTQRTLQVAKDSLKIRDTSTSPRKASYSISFEPSSLQEGDQLTTQISTENVDPGTTIHWSFSGDGINAADFSSGDLSGSTNLNRAGTFSLSHSFAQDLSTEGKEQLILQLFSDSERNNLLEQQKISIVDTSKTPQSASLLSASVDGKALSLIFDGELDDAKPSPQRFSISADGNSIPIKEASLNAKAASLTFKLDSSIKPDQNVQLTYTDLKGNQSNGVLQTPDGTDLPSFSTAVANIARDKTPPSVTTAYASDKTLTLALSEALDVTTPANSSWSLKEDGKAIPIASSSVDPLAAQLSLTLTKSLDRGSELTLGYSDLNGDQKTSVIQDLAGNDLPSFPDLSVENRTTRSSSPLNVNIAEIDGNEIVLAFDRELDSTAPSKGTFRLTSNGKAIKIKSINLNENDREATIILKSAVEHGDEVFLSYTDAKGNQKRNVIQDIDGNDLDSFVSLALSNNTRKQSKDFFVDYADADGSSINLYLTGPLSNSIPKASRFRITANKRRQLISSISTDPSDGVVTLNLKKPINSNQDVLISYRDLKGDQSSGILEDDDGNDMASFSNLAPINDTTDNDPPILQDAYLDKKEVILEFDELLTPGIIKNSRFKVRADKKRIRVTSASIPADDSIAILELKSTIPSSTKDLSLTYRDLKRDQSARIIQDMDGNDLQSLRNFPIEII